MLRTIQRPPSNRQRAPRALFDIGNSGTFCDVASQTIDPLALYAAAIDTSDYVDKVARVICANVPAIGDLLDIGAGGGQLGDAIRERGHPWTALEPSTSMRAKLARIDDGPRYCCCRLGRC